MIRKEINKQHTKEKEEKTREEQDQEEEEMKDFLTKKKQKRREKKKRRRMREKTANLSFDDKVSLYMDRYKVSKEKAEESTCFKKFENLTIFSFVLINYSLSTPKIWSLCSGWWKKI